MTKLSLKEKICIFYVIIASLAIVFCLVLLLLSKFRPSGHRIEMHKLNETYNNIKVTNEIEDRRFSILLTDKKNFVFNYLIAGDKRASKEESDYYFEDTEGEDIVFVDNAYTFINPVKTRLVYLHYSEDFHHYLNGNCNAIELKIYDIPFGRLAGDC